MLRGTPAGAAHPSHELLGTQSCHIQPSHTDLPGDDMSVPDMIRNMSKFAEKAKDLPLHMLQTALSGVGQALLLGDRVKTRIKGLGGQEEDRDASGKQTAGQLTDPEEKGGEKAEEKPARRAPVIFAPRPEKAAR